MFAKNQTVKNGFGLPHRIVAVYRRFMLVESLKSTCEGKSRFEFYTLDGEFISRASLPTKTVLFGVRNKKRLVFDELRLVAI